MKNFKDLLRLAKVYQNDEYANEGFYSEVHELKDTFNQKVQSFIDKHIDEDDFIENIIDYITEYLNESEN